MAIIKFQLFSSVWILFSFLTTFIASHPVNLTLEDQYIAHFGNNPPAIRRWFPLREVLLAAQIDNLKRLANKCHELAGRGSLDFEHLLVGIHVRKIVFNNTAYSPAHCEMMWYLEYESDNQSDMKFYHVAQGLRPDCVFYVVGDEMKRHFYLQQHVCGVPTSMFMKTPTTKEKVPIESYVHQYAT